MKELFFENILITGGLGDFLAIDTFLTEEQKSKIKKIILATRAANFIKSLFNIKNKYYPNLKKIQILDFNFKNKPSFHSIETTRFYIRMNKLFWKDVYDGSISNIFSLIRKQKLKFQESSFLDLDINIKKFSLPKKYITILPFSTNKVNDYRNFDEDDWKYLIHFLTLRKKIGVCIGIDNINIPRDKYLLDLTKQTNTLESIEILKNSCGFIGIDSWLSVLAAKLFTKSNIYIKSNSRHCYRFSNIYFRPLLDKSFLYNNLRKVFIKFGKI